MTKTDVPNIVSEAFEKMKTEGVAYYRENKPNLAELERRTQISRKKLRRLFRNGLENAVHGNTGKSRTTAISAALEKVADDMLRHGITNSSVIYERLKGAGYKGSLSSVKRYIKANEDLVPAARYLVRKPQERVTRYTTEAGEMYQMDWGFVNVTDMNDRKWRCACFAMVCHHCGMRYVEFFPNAKQESLFIGMIHAFAYMGIPEVILTDNMASVVKCRDAEGMPIFNAEYNQFQNDIGFMTKLCKARHPWTKGSVERLVQFVKGNFIQGRAFMNVTDLNEQALSWCNRENSRLQAGLGVIPRDVHETEPVKHLSDKRILIPYLAPRRKIGIDGFVYFEGRRYGVPYSYAGKVVRVMRSQEQLYILDSETFAQIERHDVDWSYSPHYSDFQFEPFQPEELPTMPVTASIEFRKDPDDDFSRYDF